MPFFEYLATDAEASDVFNRAMAGGAAARASVALDTTAPPCDRFAIVRSPRTGPIFRSLPVAPAS